ncbi:MAG: hypothetical protein ACKOKB_02750 [Bacteroidota bacterium]
MLKITRIRQYENLHIFLWLIKDTCWIMDWKPAGLFMILPTIFVAIHITWIRKGIRSDLFHNLAVCLWISGNSIWMLGEFFYDDGTRTIAVLFFAAGLISVLYYYLIEVLQQWRKNQNP